jgi:hypothetical protein
MKSILSGLAFLGVAGALLLAACGGGGGGSSAVPDAPGPATGVPAAATTSSAGALAFVKAVAASGDSSAEPIPLGDAVLAASDTDEPDPGI